MGRLALDFLRDLVQPAAKCGEIALTLLLGVRVIPKIEEQLRSILALKLFPYRTPEFIHDLRKLVHLGFGPLFEVLFKILGSLDATCIERRHQGVTMTLP